MPVAPVKSDPLIKNKIVFLLKELGSNPMGKSQELIAEDVKFYTNLDLEERNYPAIVKALEECVKAQMKHSESLPKEIPE